VWGCKAYVLEPQTEHRKDFHGKSVIEFFTGLSTDPIGWIVYCPEIPGFVTSTNVIFDQVIPPPALTYHERLSTMRITPQGERLDIDEVRKLILKKSYRDKDNSLLYDVLSVRTLWDGTIIADVALHETHKKLQAPIHVAEVIDMVKTFQQRVDSAHYSEEITAERDINPTPSVLFLESLSDGLKSSSAMIEKSHATPAEPGWDTTNLTGQPQQDAVNQTAPELTMTTAIPAGKPQQEVVCQAAPKPTMTTDMPAGGPQQEVVGRAAPDSVMDTDILTGKLQQEVVQHTAELIETTSVAVNQSRTVDSDEEANTYKDVRVALSAHLNVTEQNQDWNAWAEANGYYKVPNNLMAVEDNDVSENKSDQTLP
jgi:hypothetical protein